MNETDRGKLLRDMMATGMAARRRRRRKLRTIAMVSGGLIACLFLAMRIHSPVEKPATVRDIVESHDHSPPIQPPQAPPAKPQTEKEKDEALLKSLSDSGPIIITMADGSRQLYLTRP